MNFDYEKDSKERIPYEHYLERFKREDPLVISGRTQIPYDEERKIFTLRLMGSTYEISWPEYEVHAKEDSIGHYRWNRHPMPGYWYCVTCWRAVRPLPPEIS